jgi:hypothetical protein
MDYDSATPDQLRQASYEMQRRAQETARTYSWAQQVQQPAAFVPIPINNMSSIDFEEAALIRKRAAARRELGKALEQSGLAERWRKTDQADAELKEYFASDGYRTGAIGRLMKIGANR